MKKSSTAIAALAILICGVLAAGTALARGPHARAHVGVGLYIGVPFAGFGYYGFFPPPYYYPPYYYHPPYHPAPVVIQTQPTVYVEQSPQPAAAAAAPVQSQPSAYWYYCADARAYYPYVKDCPAGWQRVAPQPG